MVLALLRAAVLADYPALALEVGLDPIAGLRRAEIDPVVLTKPDLTIPSERVAWLLENEADRCGLPDFAVRLAMRRRLVNLGVTGLVLGQQPTVRHALAVADRYRHLLSDAVGMHLDERDGIATVAISVAIGPTAPRRQAQELAVSAYVHLFRLLLGEGWAPDAVHFIHAAPRNRRTLHTRFFGCPVLFDSAFNGIECAASDLDRVDARADRSLAAQASALLDNLPGGSGGVSAAVRRLVIALLPMGRASIESVAKSLGRNLRTLQREIAAEGASFTEILANARQELALGYLRDTSLPIKSIAERLGYSSSPAFIRWFRIRFAMSPDQWRCALPSAIASDSWKQASAPSH